MPFRFQAKYGLLTYAQCGELDPHDIVEHLGRLGAECIIGRENHQDGGVHLHSFFMFERKFRSRDVRVFDVAGCHPNIVSGYSTPDKGWDYATKDGDIVGGGLERPSGNRVSPTGSSWAHIILATDRDEFFDRIAELDPRALCTQFSSLRLYADWKYRPDRTPYATPANISFDTSRFPDLGDWVRGNLEGHTIEGKFPARPLASSPCRGQHQ